jgi:hypothetical protein
MVGVSRDMLNIDSKESFTASEVDQIVKQTTETLDSSITDSVSRVNQAQIAINRASDVLQEELTAHNMEGLPLDHLEDESSNID